jgi:O-antigen ligase
MWVFPFVNFHHAYPITTFYQEWSAVILGLCAMPFLLSNTAWEQPEIPRIVLLPIGLLLLLMVQYGLGLIPSFEQTLLFTLYFLWMALLMMLGQRLRLSLGLPLLALVLATFLIVGAELNGLAALQQHYGWRSFLSPLVTAKVSVAVYGNIAQPNHFANYLTLGLLSIGLLFVRGILPRLATIALVLPLLFVMVLSGSRSAWLYLLFILFVSYFASKRNPLFVLVFKYCSFLLLGFAAMHWIVQIPWLIGNTGTVTTVERMFGEASSGGIRLYLWHEAALIFTQFPWLGAGFGQYAWQHFQWGAVLQDVRISGLYNNAHNVVMHLAAETGLIGLGILFTSLALWLGQIRRNTFSLEHWWGYLVLAVIGIHSLLEYPLWYAYFIGIAAFMMGVLDNTSYQLTLKKLGRLSVAMILLLGVLSSLQLYQGYRKLEIALTARPLSADDHSLGARQRTYLADVYNYALLRPFSELFMSGMIEVDATRLADKLILNERTLRYIPIASVAYRQAWLLALDNRLPEAKRQLEQALWSYPADFAAANKELKHFALKDPAHFAALLEFATQKNEEYRRAISAR